MEEILIPLAFFAIIPAIVWFFTYNRRKSQESMALLMGKVIDKGESLSPDIIKALGVRPAPPHADLRKGLVLVAIGVATILFGGVVDDKEAQSVLAGIAMFPLLVGFVYVALWFILGRKAQQN